MIYMYWALLITLRDTEQVKTKLEETDYSPFQVRIRLLSTQQMPGVFLSAENTVVNETKKCP